MSKANKKVKKTQNGKGEIKPGHRTGVGVILEIIELKYIARVLCWCGNILVIDSSKSLEENVCSQCSSPYKLIDQEWTEAEMKKFMDLKETK